ncbi:MAG: helix-turn-helix domain-containing protein [Candidatus Methylacidiphilales bacterium]|nr:AraC family transcriptional regulator [Candidatus Methylacidiphilales bacterium]
MGETIKSIRETANIGSGTREIVAGADQVPAFRHYGLEVVGISHAVRGFEWVRHNPSFSQMLACLEGTGEVWTEEGWTACTAGQSYITSVQFPHAYRATNGTWKLCWTIYRAESFGSEPHPPYLLTHDATQLERAILGLHTEANWLGHDKGLDLWVKLIDLYVRSGISDTSTAPRLKPLWEKVIEDVAAPWTVAKMARVAGLSETSLQRTCIAETGVSPMRQIVRLRMRHAQSLLTSGIRVKSVAGAVGYANEFAFSSAFRRIIGQPPVDFKRKRNRGA